MKLLKELKLKGQDYEFYPTTKEIISCIKQDLNFLYPNQSPSILDVGAGDGRLLTALTHGKKFAIEQSDILISKMDKEIIIVGTDFNQNTLIDKEVDIVISNPIYSQFEYWSNRIITESFCKTIYLIIPKRWKQNLKIQDAIKTRKAKYKVIGSFDFLNADRNARAYVNVVRIELNTYQTKHFSGRDDEANDPFNSWFETEFKTLVDIFKDDEQKSKTHQKKKIMNNNLSIEEMVIHYNMDLTELYDHYQAITNLNISILKELNIELDNVKDGLKQRISGLKRKYWKTLFSFYTPITSRLTHKTRERIVNSLNEQVNIDFTEKNIYAVTQWAIKVANDYYDEQLILIFNDLANFENIKKYKSNQKIFTKNEWRWNREDCGKFKLETKIITSDKGGFDESTFNKGVRVFNEYDTGAYSCTDENRYNNAYNFLNDLLVIARNLNFDVDIENNVNNKEWDYGKRIPFMYFNHTLNEEKILFEIKYHLKGTAHIFFSTEFALNLNVNAGRILGWIRNDQEASEELNYPIEQIKLHFNTNYKIDNRADIIKLIVA